MMTMLMTAWSSRVDAFSVDSIAGKEQQLEYAVNVTNTGNVAGDAVVLAFVSGTPPDFPLSVRLLFDSFRIIASLSTAVAVRLYALVAATRPVQDAVLHQHRPLALHRRQRHDQF